MFRAGRNHPPQPLLIESQRRGVDLSRRLPRLAVDSRLNRCCIFQFWQFLQSGSFCPIVYEVLEELKNL